MYQFNTILSGKTFDPGASLLISGTPSVEARRIGLEVLATGSRRGEGAIVVSTDEPASEVLERYAGVVGDAEDLQVGVVDCVSQHQNRDRNRNRDPETGTDDPQVKYAPSPGNLSRIGIQVSAFLEEFREVRGLDRNRVLLDSVSTTLDHADPETVFRFLHVFNSRIESTGALGVCLIDASAHDSQTLGTLGQLFDGVIEFEDGGEPTLRRPGIAPR